MFQDRVKENAKKTEAGTVETVEMVGTVEAAKEQKATGGGNTGGGAGGGKVGGEMSPLTEKGRTALKGGIRRAILSTLEVRVTSTRNEQHTFCCCCCWWWWWWWWCVLDFACKR